MKSMAPFKDPSDTLKKIPSNKQGIFSYMLELWMNLIFIIFPSRFYVLILKYLLASH